MRPNVITAPPEIQQEIEQALSELKKGAGYQVTARQDAADGLILDFHFGATEQTLKFSKGEMQKSGTVKKRIIDKLEI
ncbi:MAG: hypothetical protein JO091_03155 [Acidobacteriaceae bacterium]|nr:hypothetical protein [Acidobacteriaceae bacterium]